MRVVFFGSGEFGIPALEMLVAKGYDIPLVVTQPDRPAGRGGGVKATPLKESALRLGLSVTSPEKPSTPEFAAELATLAPDLAVIVAYGHLIKRALLDIPRKGFINLHASLLPAYRGAAPVPWAILSGEEVSGVTIFQLDERFDTGSIIAKAELAITSEDTSESYLAKLAPIGGDLMARTVTELAEGRVTPLPQDHAKASSAPKFRKEDGEIDWQLDWQVIERKVRALQPWPQAYALLQTAKGSLRVNVSKMQPVACASSAAPGSIITADSKSGLLVMTGNGAVRLSLIQPEGKRRMADLDFLRGTKIEL